jgi:hypothetical protein
MVADHCPHANKIGIYGDEINRTGGFRLRCADCGRYLNGPVSLAEPAEAGGRIRTATVYRTKARDLKPDFEQANYNDGAEPQFELAEFSDGRVAHRWLVAAGSCVWWDSLADLYAVHIYAHPDYGTRVEWNDGKIEEL